MHFKAPYVFIAPRARTSDGSNNATTIPQAERSNKMHWRFLLDFLLGRTMGVCGNSKERHHQPRVDRLFLMLFIILYFIEVKKYQMTARGGVGLG